MTRKVLLVTYHFPPSAASGTFRMLSFARHLPRYGWQVEVVAPPEMPWDPVDPALQVPAETAYHAVPYPKRWPRVLRMMAPYAVWLPRAWRACRQIIRRERPDLVLTSGPPHVVHLLGLWLHRAARLPWIADFRDPWISGIAKGRLRLGQRWWRYWERQVLAHADRVIANAPNAGRMFQKTYPRQAGKVVTLTNGFDPRSTPQGESASPAGGAVRMLHAGEIYWGRDPLPLLDAMAALKQAGPAAAVRLEVMGTVHLPQGDLATEIARRNLGAEVSVTGQLPYQAAKGEMERADLLVLFDGPGRTIGVPAKLYEYLGAGRPVLALAEPDGDTAQVLRDSGVCHRIAPPKDVPRITQALAELVREIAAGTVPASDPVRLRRFTRESIARELASVMEQVAAQAVVTPQAFACGLEG